MDLDSKLVCIGGGNMARALIGGLIRRGWPAPRITVGEPEPALRARLEQEFSVRCFAHNLEAAAAAEVLLLAVKPQVMPKVLHELRDWVRERQALVISIAAGITLATLERGLGGHRRLVRAMPNTPALIGAGISALYAGSAVGDVDRALVQAILEATGEALWVESEALLDVVTAVSGSGPAYVFLLLEAMHAAAVARGLPAALARRLVAQTALGAARMVQEESADFAQERARVTSPGGTTAAALQSLERDGFTAAIDRAIGAATERAAELGRNYHRLESGP